MYIYLCILSILLVWVPGSSLFSLYSSQPSHRLFQPVVGPSGRPIGGESISILPEVAQYGVRDIHLFPRQLRPQSEAAAIARASGHEDTPGPMMEEVQQHT